MTEKKKVKSTAKKPSAKKAQPVEQDKEKEKELVRVQFKKDVKAKGIVDAIDNIQTQWARKYPERAHRLYPEIFNEKGECINPLDSAVKNIQPSEQAAEDRGFTPPVTRDRSLQAYKDWISGMYSSIIPNGKTNLTEEEWEQKWKEFWAKVDKPSTKKKTKPKITSAMKQYDKKVEELLPEIQEEVLPSCPHCGSEDTARVHVGVIGITMQLAASTKKFKLVPNINNKLGTYFCNKCEKFYD